MYAPFGMRILQPPGRVVFTWAWEDDAGKPGGETLVTLTFRADGAATEMTLLHERYGQIFEIASAGVTFEPEPSEAEGEEFRFHTGVTHASKVPAAVVNQP